jgi:hypothetical protein
LRYPYWGMPVGMPIAIWLTLPIGQRVEGNFEQDLKLN